MQTLRVIFCVYVVTFLCVTFGLGSCKHAVWLNDKTMHYVFKRHNLSIRNMSTTRIGSRIQQIGSSFNTESETNDSKDSQDAKKQTGHKRTAGPAKHTNTRDIQRSLVSECKYTFSGGCDSAVIHRNSGTTDGVDGVQIRNVNAVFGCLGERRTFCVVVVGGLRFHVVQEMAAVVLSETSHFGDVPNKNIAQIEKRDCVG